MAAVNRSHHQLLPDCTERQACINLSCSFKNVDCCEKSQSSAGVLRRNLSRKSTLVPASLAYVCVLASCHCFRHNSLSQEQVSNCESDAAKVHSSSRRHSRLVPTKRRVRCTSTNTPRAQLRKAIDWPGDADDDNDLAPRIHPNRARRVHSRF